MAEKKRLDLLVFEQGYTESREKARAIIMAGQVYVNNQKSDKPGTQYTDKDILEVRGCIQKYVSRGGLKLEKAINFFQIDLQDKIAMDIGASTGGFTDCMLQNGAKKVFAVDVGYGQLAWKLRNDERVVNLERKNIRYITKEEISDDIDFASVDVSFISLKLVLPVAEKLLKNNGQIVALIKPQFEAGRENVGKKGVVRDKQVHYSVVSEICSFCTNNGFKILGLDFSPIKGPEGNIEYLVFLQKSDDENSEISLDIQKVIDASHIDLE
ncbi:MAG: TlyA family RNA methyltransferase [Bacillota bacterium]|nr:TlyA family RNA methyltransferase [Bacillota bacterium]